MGLKIFKAFWFLSMLAVLANLLYVYASLPETVVIQDEGVDLSFDRQGGILLSCYGGYCAGQCIGLSSFPVYIREMWISGPGFMVWLLHLISSFVISLSFIALFNSGERYDYG